MVQICTAEEVNDAKHIPVIHTAFVLEIKTFLQTSSIISSQGPPSWILLGPAAAHTVLSLLENVSPAYMS